MKAWLLKRDFPVHGNQPERLEWCFGEPPWSEDVCPKQWQKQNKWKLSVSSQISYAQLVWETGQIEGSCFELQLMCRPYHVLSSGKVSLSRSPMLNHSHFAFRSPVDPKFLCLTNPEKPWCRESMLRVGVQNREKQKKQLVTEFPGGFSSWFPWLKLANLSLADL